MKRPARDSNQWPQRLEEKTLTTTPLSPTPLKLEWESISQRCLVIPVPLTLEIRKQTVRRNSLWHIYFIYLDFNITFNTVQVIKQGVVLRAEETSTYSWFKVCIVNWRPLVSNYQLYHMGSGIWTTGFRGGRQVFHHCVTGALICDLYKH